MGSRRVRWCARAGDGFVATVSKTAVFAFPHPLRSPLSFQESPALLWGFASSP
ncbi:MAG: hypothetical protein IPK53_09520 [bacterium]|nr:hypothetical protein [bacterium]